MITNYTWQTPDHSFDFVPDPLSPDNIHVRSEFKDSLEEFLSTLELAGRANDEDFTELHIEEGTNDYDAFFYVDVTRADLSLYLDFEVRYFMGVRADV